MKNRHWIVLFLLFFLLCLAAVFFLTKKEVAHPVAEIYQNGVLVQSVDLADLKQEEIVLKDGEKENILLIKDGAVSMKSANCPDKLCVKTGPIQNGLYPIVCLPNKVTVSVKNGGKPLADAVSQ